MKLIALFIEIRDESSVFSFCAVNTTIFYNVHDRKVRIDQTIRNEKIAFGHRKSVRIDGHVFSML